MPYIYTQDCNSSKEGCSREREKEGKEQSWNIYGGGPASFLTFPCRHLWSCWPAFAADARMPVWRLRACGTDQGRTLALLWDSVVVRDKERKRDVKRCKESFMSFCVALHAQ